MAEAEDQPTRCPKIAQSAIIESATATEAAPCGGECDARHENNRRCADLGDRNSGAGGLGDSCRPAGLQGALRSKFQRAIWSCAGQQNLDACVPEELEGRRRVELSVLCHICCDCSEISYLNVFIENFSDVSSGCPLRGPGEGAPSFAESAPFKGFLRSCRRLHRSLVTSTARLLQHRN